MNRRRDARSRFTSRMRSRIRSRSFSATADKIVNTSLLMPLPVSTPIARKRLAGVGSWHAIGDEGRQAMSAVAHTTDSSRTSGHVRFVPQPDSCTAAMRLFDHLVGASKQCPTPSLEGVAPETSPRTSRHEARFFKLRHHPFSSFPCPPTARSIEQPGPGQRKALPRIRRSEHPNAPMRRGPPHSWR